MAADVCICIFACYDYVVTRGIGYKFVICIDERVKLFVRFLAVRVVWSDDVVVIFVSPIVKEC